MANISSTFGGWAAIDKPIPLAGLFTRCAAKRTVGNTQTTMRPKYTTIAALEL